MSPVKKLLSDLQRLRGMATVKIGGMDSSEMIETLANAILDLEARFRDLDRRTHGDGR